MDGTVIPLESDRRWEADVAEFRDRVESTPDLILAYVTGRDFPLALKGIRKHGLPEPDFLVCDVGTSVYRATAHGFQQDRDYARAMEEAMGGLSAGEVRSELEAFPDLLLQPEERQTPFKVSYHLSPGAPHQDILRAVHSRLEGLGGRIQAVYSVRARDGMGLLDLLPFGVAKDYALHFLRECTGVEPDRVVYAGDSGNDLAAMFSGYRVVVVGNAEEGLRNEIRREAEGRDLSHLLYFAEAPYAGGVLEGCRYFGLF